MTLIDQVCIPTLVIVYMRYQLTHHKLAPLTCKGGNPQKPGRQPGVTPNALLDYINTIAPPKVVCHRREPQLAPSQVLSVTDLLKCQMCEQMLVQPLTLHCNAVVCTKCISDYIATSASTQCPCCDDSVNLLPSSVQPAPVMIQRLIHDVMVSCTTCNKHIRAGDYLSESTKDNIIQIQTGGTVSKEWVMSVYLLSSSVAIDACACDKGPIFQK